MTERSCRPCFTGEEVVNLLDLDGEDVGQEDYFFPGSDDELGFLDNENEEDPTGRTVSIPGVVKEIFFLFFTSSLLEHIIEQSNK